MCKADLRLEGFLQKMRHGTKIVILYLWWGGLGVGWGGGWGGVHVAHHVGWGWVVVCGYLSRSLISCILMMIHEYS